MYTKAEKKALSEKKMKEYYKQYHARRYKELKKDPLLTPVEHLEQHHPQFVLFFQDCLLPSVEFWVKFSKIYSTYLRYCKAIKEEPKYKRPAFGKILQQCLNKKMRADGSFYGAMIRSQIFLSTTHAEVEPEFIVDGVPLPSDGEAGDGVQD